MLGKKWKPKYLSVKIQETTPPPPDAGENAAPPSEQGQGAIVVTAFVPRIETDTVESGESRLAVEQDAMDTSAAPSLPAEPTAAPKKGLKKKKKKAKKEKNSNQLSTKGTSLFVNHLSVSHTCCFQCSRT